MKKALVVTFGSVLAAGMISTASANYNLAERQFLGHLALWVEGDYMKPSNNGVSVGDRWGATLAQDEFRQPVFVDFGSDWDYQLGFSYHIPHSHCRFFFNYEQFSDGQDDGFGGLIALGVGNAGNIGPNTSVSVHSEHHYREFKAGFIHTFNHTRRFHLDMSAFFAFDKLRRSTDEFLVNLSAVNDTRFRSIENKVDAWGPGLGLMGRVSPFACWPHVGFFAGSNTELLWTHNNYENYQVNDGALQYFWNPERSESVVGKLDISFGIDYAHACRTDIGGMLFDISVGMRYMNMFNVLKNGNVAYDPLVDGALSDFAFYFGAPNDFGKFGPFVKFKIGGLHA